MPFDSISILTVRLEIFLLRVDIILEIGWGWLKRVVLVLEEILLGMNSRSFELLFILRWEIVPIFVSNEKLLLNFVFSIRTFVFYEKKVSYARILREESLIFALNENKRFNSQCLKRYTNYSKSISLPFARE